MESTVAVHVNGFEFRLYWWTKWLILAMSSSTLLMEPRRITCWVINPNHRSTWLSHDECVGVK